MDKKQITKIIIVLITIVLFGLLLSQISLSDLTRSFTSISIQYLALCFVMYTASNIVRAVRFSVMLKKIGDLPTIFKITCIHNMANNIMPFKTGELAFVYLTKSRFNLSVSIGAVTVAIARLYDSLAICVLFMLAVIVAGERSSFLNAATPIMMFLGAVLALFILSVMWFSQLFESILGKIPGVKVFNKDPIKFLQAKVKEVSSYYSTAESKRNMAILLFLSLLIWVLNTSSTYILITNLGVYMDFWLIAIGTLVSVVFTVIPVHGVGRFGTSELYWSSIFIALGASKEMAISSGIVTHIVLLAFTIVLGFSALIADRYHELREKNIANVEKI